MIGHPQYKYGDLVFFQVNNNIYSGQVCVVDAYGVSEDDTEVHYDIFRYDPLYYHEKIIQKHVPEYDVIEKIGYGYYGNYIYKSIKSDL